MNNGNSSRSHADVEEFFSVVIPLYRSEPTIKGVVEEVEREFERSGIERYEIILVNDHSPDGVLGVATDLAMRNDRIAVLDLAKNVGQVNAMHAGFAYASGDYVISMDDDMQTPGYEIGGLIRAIQERGDDVVFAAYREVDGKRSVTRRIGTRLNWFMAEKMTKKPKGIQTNSFFIMRKYVKDAYVAYDDRKIYPYGIIFECTDRVSNLVVDHRARAIGESGWNLGSLFRLWSLGALSFSMTPLRVASAAGILLLAASVVGMTVSALAFRYYVGLFFAGVFIVALQLISTGLLGEYVGRIFMTESNLPRYIIRDVIHGNSQESSNQNAD